MNPQVFEYKDIKKHLEILQKSESSPISEERKRIRNDLHDGLGFYLSCANLKLATLKEKHTGKNDDLDKELTTIAQYINDASTDLRRIFNNLSPKDLTQSDLETSIRKITQTVEAVSNIKINVEFSIKDIAVSSDCAACLYRITQEAMTNVLKRQSTKALLLRFKSHEDRISISLIETNKNISSGKCGLEPYIAPKSLNSRTRACGGYALLSRCNIGSNNLQVEIPQW